MKRISFVTIAIMGAIAFLGAWQRDLLFSWVDKVKEMFNSIGK